MKKFLLIFITILIFSTPLKTEEAIVGTVDGMFCIACQEHLQTALKEEFGEQAVITVSWEDGLAVVSIPSKGKITEKAFKKVVENEGFKYGEVAKAPKVIENLDEVKTFINGNSNLFKVTF